MLGRERRGGRLALGAALLAAGGAAGYRIARGPQPPPDLPPALSGERIEFTGRAGRLSYYVAGEGPPLLLVHSINAAGSAYEVRPIFEALLRHRRVYAVDLPGFGFSDRSERRYEVALYVAAIHDMLDVVMRDRAGPVDALALSLSSEFLARVALARPEAFRSLAFVTPTGFGRPSRIAAAGAGEGDAEATREVPGLHAAFSVPLWSEGLWSLLVSRASIRYFLKRTFGSPEIDEDLLDYDWRTARQPGARYAPLAFVSGRLFAVDPGAFYRRLAGPVLMTQATRGDFGDFSGSGWARARPNWRVETIETGALPHFEAPERFIALYEDFLGAPPAQAPSSASSRSPSP